MLIENLKNFSSKEQIKNEINKLNFTEFLDLFEEIDETQSNNKETDLKFDNKSIANIFYVTGIQKIYDNINLLSNKNYVSFYKWDNNKFILDKNTLEEYFVKKDEAFLRDTFTKKARKQILNLGFAAAKREIKYNKSKSNIHFYKFKSFLLKKDYEMNEDYINESYEIAKRKIKELKMLFTFNGDVYFSKTKDKNIIDFQNQKNILKKQIKSELKTIEKNTNKIEILKRKKDIFEKGLETDYDYEFWSKCLEVKINYLEQKKQKVIELDKGINTSQQKWLTVKKDKNKYINESKLNLKQLDNEYHEKLSYVSTASEIRDIKQNYRKDKKVVVQSNEYSKAKIDIKYKKYYKKIELKKLKLEYISKVENINNSIPIEIPSWKKVLSPIVGIIPGLGQFANKQYKKGALMLLFIPLIITFLSYGFGFGNVGGIGLPGLIDFGKSDPSGDGRFYLIEGIISIILIAVSGIIILSSILDSRLVAKQQYLGSRARSWSQTNEFLKTQGTPYLLSIPAIIGILFIVLVPIIATIIIAFTNYGKGNDPARPGQYIEWVGFENFKAIFGGQYSTSFSFVLLWTVLWVIFASVGAIGVGTLAALMVNNDRLKGKSAFRLVLILPWAVPAFIMIMMFSLLLGSVAFNNFTEKIFSVSGWTSQQSQARIAIIFIQIWLGQSYIFLLITGVLQGVSKDIYEASSIDGANKFEQTYKLTLPIVFGQIAPLILGQFVFNFGNFGIISLYGANGIALAPDGFPYPGEPGITDILISFVYKLSTSQTNYTYGVAAAFIIVSSFIVVSISAIGFKNMKAFKN